MQEKEKPRVSVIIPCFNDGKYLNDAIESVEKCKRGLYEIIVVDDGSTDEKTISLIEKLKKDGYHIIKSENHGPSHARNLGIKKSIGEYIFPVDADNLIKPEYMTEGVRILDENPGVGVVFSDCIHFDENTEKYVDVDDFNPDKMAKGNYIDTCTVFRRKAWIDCGGYDEKLYAWEDWELWINTYTKGWQLHHIPKALFYYRNKPGSLSKTCTQPEILKKIKERVYMKHPDFFKDKELD